MIIAAGESAQEEAPQSSFVICPPQVCQQLRLARSADRRGGAADLRCGLKLQAARFLGGFSIRWCLAFSFFLSCWRSGGIDAVRPQS